jgi:hypothetical protein
MRVLLTSALYEGEWPSSRLENFAAMERAVVTYWTGTGPDALEKEQYILSAQPVAHCYID